MTKKDGWIPLGSTLKDRTAPDSSEQQRKDHDLSGLLSSEPVSTGSVTPIFLAVIAAVKEAHAENKGSRNLDPRKIRLKSDGAVELSNLTPLASGMTFVLSSSKYSAPEMVEETAGPIDSGVSDSYVLGFVFYEILLGKNLFEQQFKDVSGHGEFGWLTWHADKTKRAKPLSEVISGFPPMLSNLIDGMMTKDASERIVDLDRIADTIGGASNATMVISNLSALQAGDKAWSPPKISSSQRVDTFWREFTSKVCSGLRGVFGSHPSTGRHKQTPSSVHDAKQSFKQEEATRIHPIKAYGSTNTKKGSGVER
jgi:serine/threonine protein kinase